MSFGSLNLPDYLKQSLKVLGFTQATEIQQKAIPLIQDGHDVLAESQTGTGKTLTFAFPIIQKINDSLPKKKKISILGLILVPTRELALQVEKAFNTYQQTSPNEIKVASIIGGEDIDGQIRRLRIGLDLVIATPGRLLELFDLGEIRLFELQTLVLDEADKMLDLGFQDELNELLEKLPQKRQNLLFSATMPSKVTELASKFLNSPCEVKANEEQITVEAIEQRVIEVDKNQRRQVLQKLIKEEKWSYTIIFVASKRAAFNLANKLKKANIDARDFHGDLNQEERKKVLKKFKNKDFPILIATDIAARGIDIDSLSHVVNYDLPRSPMDYVHRIGRTGRAGQSGVAISFIDNDSQSHFKKIEKVAGIKLQRERIPGFENLSPASAPVKKSGAIKGKRKSKKDKLREQAAKNNKAD